MIGPEDVEKWALAVWPDYLRSIISSQPFFPLRRDRLGRIPASVDPIGFASAVTPLWEGSKAMRGFGYSVVLEPRQRRSRHLQNEPIAIEFENEAEYLDLLQRSGMAQNFKNDLSQIRAMFPQSLEALKRRPDIIVDNHGSWSGILEVAEYLLRNPRPGCFVRALPVRVHTKFIEAHQLAIETIVKTLPGYNYDQSGESFASRCGFAEDEPSIRGRFLDPSLQYRCGFAVQDVTLRISAWAALDVPWEARIVACENKTNFLALPNIEGTLALFGGGGASTGHFQHLPWLHNKTFIYWGDLDPCGMAILSRLRRSIPSVKSLLMDAKTLTQHADKLGDAKLSPNGIEMDNLSEIEREAATFLVAQQLGLEQEKLLFSDCIQKLHSALALATD